MRFLSESRDYERNKSEDCHNFSNSFYTNVCIVGAGIAGCTLGRYLHGKEDYLIFEKDIHFNQRKQGYGLTIQQGSRALKKLNLFDKITKIDMKNIDTFVKKNNFFSARQALSLKHDDYGRNISIIMIN